MNQHKKPKYILPALIFIFLLFAAYIMVRRDGKFSLFLNSHRDLDISYNNVSYENFLQRNAAVFVKMQEKLQPNCTIYSPTMTEGDAMTNHRIKNSLISSERVTFQEGFYYEPITNKIKARIYGISYKEGCKIPFEDLRYVSVLYHNFDGETASGEIICNKAIAQDLAEIFYELYQNDYPIEKITLIDEYNADDDLSCADNNTSSFNYRVVAGTTTLSKHALGMAIDINPFYNPYITYPDGVERISPKGSEPYADRDADLPYMIKKGDLCYNLFIQHGFTWGGEWKSVKDYQHFQKE